MSPSLRPTRIALDDYDDDDDDDDDDDNALWGDIFKLSITIGH